MKRLLVSSFALILLGATSSSAQNGTTGTSGSSRSTSRETTVPNDYRLVIGDKLRIEVYKDPQLSQSLQIRPDGKITLPLVGDIVAAGHTPLALRDSIAASLKEYITNPVVTVIVVETEAPTFSVMGEVNNPGQFPLKRRVSVIEALAMAGGFKDFANTKDISIRRSTASGMQTIEFNYKDAVKGDARPVYLQPGDILIVP
jgi:polysaccharide export outer membrane protein